MPSPLWTLCEGLLAGISAREPRREDCAALARSFGAGPRYWSQLDAPFRAFIIELADATDISVEGGATRYGMRALLGWAVEIQLVAHEVFNAVINDLDGSARMLHAQATAEQHFKYLLATLMAPYRRESITAETEGATV